MKNKLVIIVLITASIIPAGCNIFRNRFDRSIDSAVGMMMLNGIHQQVTIRRDALGIPFVEGCH